MKLTTEPKCVLAICLNPAWQKTLIFSHFTPGEVNRAREKRECGGGKGTNVVRVFRNLGLPICLAGFSGGENGRKLEGELRNSGAAVMLEQVAAETRCCITLISEDDAQVSELIEPAGAITEAESASLLKRICGSVSDFGAVVCSGSVPPGIAPSFSAEVAASCARAGVPFILDAVKDITPTLQNGVTLLKINASELRQITDRKDLKEAGRVLLESYPKLENLAVTDGPYPAWTFSRTATHRITLPPLPKIVSPIGGGDCATAVMTRRIAEEPNTYNLTQSFAEACACSSASCLTDTPSLFRPQEAQEILARTKIEEMPICL